MSVDLPLDWFLLILRLVFIGLLFFFLYQVMHVTIRELNALAGRSAPSATPPTAAVAQHLQVVEPAAAALHPGMLFTLEPVNVIGRRPDCTIVLDEPYVSGEHSELSLQGGEWQLRDLGSTNGTYVNGQRLTAPVALRPGDTVQFGRIKLRLVS